MYCKYCGHTRKGVKPKDCEYCGHTHANKPKKREAVRDRCICGKCQYRWNDQNFDYIEIPKPREVKYFWNMVLEKLESYPNQTYTVKQWICKDCKQNIGSTKS